MASSSVTPRTLDLPIRRARAELVPETRGFLSVDGWLLVVIAAICAFGLVMVYSASEVLAYQTTGNPSYYFERQLVFLILGATALLLLSRFDYHRLQRWARPLAGLAVVLLVLVLVPHIGQMANGSRRWFSLGPLDLQPSAVAMVIAIIVLARWISDRNALVHSWRGVRDYTVVLAIPIALILLEKDLGSAIVIAGVGLLLLFLGGARRLHLLGIVALGAAVGWIAILMEPYRLSRLTCFGQPVTNDRLNACWQGVQALYGLGSGGITGVGLGNSIQKYSWLPEAHTDFIFAIIGEELGLIGTVAVLLAFTFLAWRGIRAALRAPDSFGFLLAGGITAWICIQAFINIAAVTVLIPTTGIPLPFISYGGSSLMVNLMAVGILCNVSAQGRRQGAMRRANVDRRGGDGRTSDAGAGGRRRVARL